MRSCLSQWSRADTLQLCFQASHAIADRSAAQNARQSDEQQQLVASKALQPVLAASFGQTDTAIARQQDLSKVTKCIAAILLTRIGPDPAAAEQRIENAFASMFSAASLPRLASLSKHERETELKQLANVTLGGYKSDCMCLHHLHAHAGGQAFCRCMQSQQSSKTHI